MATDLIIDFNGYFMPNNEYKIKELSLFVLERDTVRVEYSVVMTSKPRCPWKILDYQSKIDYAMYFEKHGVDWDSGDKSLEDIYDNLLTYLLESECIYVRNNEQQRLLLNFLNEPEDESMYEFVCLDDLGYANPLKMSTRCSHHQQQNTKNCANDNLLDMARWLNWSKLYTSDGRKKMHMVVDFIGYDLPHGVFAVKEFGAITMDQNGVLQLDYYHLVKPPYDFERLPLSYKLSYDYFYDRHGISWNAGELPYKECKETFTDYFRNVKYIYVRNLTQKKLLMELIGDNIEIISLDKLKFNDPPQMFTLCPNHKHEKYICAADNCSDLTMWLEKNKIYKPIVRKNYLNQLSAKRMRSS